MVRKAFADTRGKARGTEPSGLFLCIIRARLEYEWGANRNPRWQIVFPFDLSAVHAGANRYTAAFSEQTL